MFYTFNLKKKVQKDNPNYYFVAIKGIEDENEKESTENAVLSLRKKFSQNIQSRETFNQPRRWASETTINTVNQIPSLTDEETKTTIKGESLIEKHYSAINYIC